MNNLQRAQSLADFDVDTCRNCAQSEGICIHNPKISKCLHGPYLVITYDNRVCTIRPDKRRDDFRRYNFEDELTHDQLGELLRCAL